MSKQTKKAKLNRSTIRRVLSLIRPYAGSVALTLTLAVITCPISFGCRARHLCSASR